MAEFQKTVESQTGKALAWQLETVLAKEAVALAAISEEQSVVRRTQSAWSHREELGHLIDSAVNNHLRFVVASIQNEFQGQGYAQDDWVRAHGYHQLSWNKLIALWESHNALLVEVIQRIPENKLQAPCKIGAGEPVSLGFLIEDYILHLQHHLDHILDRAVITHYLSQ